MPRFYGTPSAKSAPLIRTRGDFNRALRENDSKSLVGLWGGDDSDGDTASFGGLMGYATLFPGVRTHRFQGFSSYIEAGTKKVWASARAVDLIANVVLSTETKLVWRDPEKNKAQKKIKVDPELTRLLQNPNPHETISELLYLWVAHMELTGNAFWLKDEMNGKGQPKHIYALNPAFMIIVPDAEQRVARYLYRVNGKEIPFEPREITHFRRPHAGDPLWGLGVVESGESLFEDFINRALYNTRFMANGAMPSSVLVNETYDGSQDDWEKLQRSFQDKYSGVRNSGKTAWFNGKWSLLQMGLTAAAMQEMEKSTKNIEEIFMHHGVPHSVAGIGAAANFATSRQDDLNFRRYKCLPLINWFCDAVNSPRGFMLEFNPDVRLDFQLSGLVDVEQIAKENAPLFDRGGLTPNDFREACGLPRKDDPFLDQHFILSGYTPIELAGISAPSDPALATPDAPAPPPDVSPDAPGKPAKPKPKPLAASASMNTADGGAEAKPPKRLAA